MNALMTDFDFGRGSEPVPEKWEGLAELDRALAENRLAAYRWRKSWSDPWARSMTIAVAAATLTVFGFLAGLSFGLW